MPLIERIPNNFSTSFSNAVVVTMGEYSTIYISGHVGYVVGGPVKVTAETFEEEAKICYFNIEKSLQEVGATLNDVVRITAYLTERRTTQSTTRSGRRLSRVLHPRAPR
jgi:enamine deaminase RidA (YjgF/YER057c/UK114 family)